MGDASTSLEHQNAGRTHRDGKNLKLASNRSSLRGAVAPAAAAADDEAETTHWHATLEAARRVLRFHASEFAPDTSSGASQGEFVTEGTSTDDSTRSRA